MAPRLPEHANHFGVTFGQTTPATPGLAGGFDGKLYVAWTGTDGKHHLNIESSSNGVNWGNQVVLNELALCCNPDIPPAQGGLPEPELRTGPRLLANPSNGRIYIAWVGTTQNINIGYFNGTANLSGKVTLRETTRNTVGLTWANGVMYIAWTGEDSGNHLNIISSTDGLNWGNKVELNVEDGIQDIMIPGPGLGQINQTVWLAWLHRNDGNLNICTGGFNGGTSLDHVDCPPNATGLNGSQDLNLSNDAGTMYLTFGCNCLTNAFLWGTTTNGYTWSGTFSNQWPKTWGSSEDVGPNGHFYTAWVDTTNRLNVDELAV